MDNTNIANSASRQLKKITVGISVGSAILGPQIALKNSGKSEQNQAGRSGVIRTLDPHVPNVVRYQTALHSVTSGASIDQPFLMHKHQIQKNHLIFDEKITAASA